MLLDLMMLLQIFSLALITFQEVEGRAAAFAPQHTMWAASMQRALFSPSPRPGPKSRITRPSCASTTRKREDEALQAATSSGEPAVKTIFVLSDETGVSARSAVEKMLDYQFNEVDERFTHLDSAEGQEYGEAANDDEDDEDRCEMARLDVRPFTRTEEDVVAILRKAEEIRGMVVFTFSDSELRAKTSKMCELSNLIYVDLASALFHSMTAYFHRKPHGSPREDPPHLHKWALSDSYYKRVEAIEFTLKCDDGESTSRLSEADVILVGVSRTGKTPLSVVLSQTMGLKVANIPLVVDESIPPQLFGPGVDKKRVFCLTLDPADLRKIRRTRMKRALSSFGPTHGCQSSYDDTLYISRDLENARRIANEHGFTVIDVTGRAVEETANLLVSMLYERFPPITSNNAPLRDNSDPIIGG